MSTCDLSTTSDQSVFRFNYILLFLSGLYLIFGLLAPFLYYLKLPFLDEYYRIGKTLCIQRPSRCFWYLDEHTALCSKCLGLYSGIALASLSIVWRWIEVCKITKLGATTLFAIFLLMVSHSVLRSFYGWLLLPVAASFALGVVGGCAFAIIVSYTILKYRGLAMLFSGKRWLVIIGVIVLLHAWGFANAFAQESKANEPAAQTKGSTDEEIKSLKQEIEKLKKEKRAQEMKNEAQKLQRELKALKETERAKELMQRPLPKSAEGAPLRVPIQRMVIHAGAPVILQVETGFSTEEVKEGDSIALFVQRPVTVDNLVVIRQGVAARAKVTSCKPAKSWGGAGEITITVKSVPAVDGSEIMLSGSANRKGDTSHGAATAVAVGTGILCLPLALTGAAVTGEEGKFPPGYEIVAHVDGDHTVKIFSQDEQRKIFETQKTEAEKLSEEFKKQVEKNQEKKEEANKAADKME